MLDDLTVLEQRVLRELYTMELRSIGVVALAAKLGDAVRGVRYSLAELRRRDLVDEDWRGSYAVTDLGASAARKLLQREGNHAA